MNQPADSPYFSNGIIHTMLCDEMFRQVSQEYSEVRADQFHIYELAAALVLRPEKFDVLGGSKLFGDILSNLARPSQGASASPSR